MYLSFVPRRPSVSLNVCRAAPLDDLYNFNANPGGITKLVIRPQDLAPRGTSAASSSIKLEMLFRSLPLARNLVELKVLGMDDSLGTAEIAGDLRWGDSERQQLANALHSLGRLTHLSLSGSIGVGKKAADTLAPALGSLKTLQLLDLSHTDLGAEGAALLAPAIESLTSLQHLDISHAGLDYGAGIQQPIPSDFLGLKSLSNLLSLNLSGNNLGAGGASQLAQAITHCSKLTHLNLSGDSLSDVGIAIMAPAAVKSVPLLQHLNLSGNKLGRRGATKLAPALHSMSKTLDSLDLSNNFGWLGEEETEGIVILAPAIRALASLRSLSLRCTGLGVKEVAVLEPTLAALKHCIRLQQLDLSGNGLEAEALVSSVIPALLPGLTTLQRLKLCNNGLDDEQQQVVTEEVVRALWEDACTCIERASAAAGHKPEGSQRTLQRLHLGDSILLDFGSSEGNALNP